MRKDVALKSFGVFLLFILLSFLYLYPGSLYLLEGRDDIFLSDGTDSTTQSHQFGLMMHEFREHPSHLFYGAVYTPSMNSPEGLAVWNIWPERFFAVLAGPFIPLEQLPTAWSIALLVASGLSFVALGRYLKWPWAVTLGVSIAWAFSGYTRARAKVHIGFLGLYFLPLVFLALWILHKGKSRRSVALAGLLLLMASTTAQYYVLMLAFLIPFPLFIYFYLERNNRKFSSSLKRLCLAGLPALAFCIYLIVVPIPSEFRNSVRSIPSTGESTEAIHPFLEGFAAQPLDYFTGDSGIAETDLNPLRQMLTEYNFESNPRGNAHERTNGIRWILWLTLLALIAFKIKDRKAIDSKNLILGLLFFVFGLAGFLLSLPPSFFGGSSPSLWLNSILPQFRVSSRAGIFVHFSVLMIVGLWLTEFAKKIEKTDVVMDLSCSDFDRPAAHV